MTVQLHWKIHWKDARSVWVMWSRDLGWNSTSILWDACQYLDTSQDAQNVPTSWQTLYIVSTSANDTIAWTWARSVRYLYLDSTGAELSWTVNLNWTTPVSIWTWFTAIQWMEVFAAWSIWTAAGNISITSTNWAATVATTFERIAVWWNRSLSWRYKIPLWYDWYVMQWHVNAIWTTMDCRLRADVRTDNWRTLQEWVFIFQDRAFVWSWNNQDIEMHFQKYPALSTIKVSAIPWSAPAWNKLDCDFSIILIAQ